jgi:hypothetical protein
VTGQILVADTRRWIRAERKPIQIGSSLTDEVRGAVDDGEGSDLGDWFGFIERSATYESFELVVWSVYEQCATGGVDQGPLDQVQSFWSSGPPEGNKGDVSSRKHCLHCVIKPLVRRSLLEVGRLQRQSSTQVLKGSGGFVVRVGIAHDRLSGS